jgi:MFS family permease
MAGMLVGGVVWGILGDRIGRIQLLFGSILLYFVATIGTMGAVVGGVVADMVDWRTAYFIGGRLGLALLFQRMSVAESGMFSAVKQSGVKRGSFLSLFTDGERFRKHLRCILIGVPTWHVGGILFTLSPELAKALEINGEVKAAYAVIASVVHRRMSEK